jgi:hypothetical protein
VNDSGFKGFAAGECLFLGAAGTKRGSGDWEIGYRFASSPNVTGLTVGDITGINKKDSHSVGALDLDFSPIARSPGMRERAQRGGTPFR